MPAAPERWPISQLRLVPFSPGSSAIMGARMIDQKLSLL
jgi:hypothetical protein